MDFPFSICFFFVSSSHIALTNDKGGKEIIILLFLTQVVVGRRNAYMFAYLLWMALNSELTRSVIFGSNGCSFLLSYLFLMLFFFPDIVAIVERMATVKHKILVLSGKGGVGKSTFSAQLAFALAAKDFQVGLLDIDICGPSIPKMLGLEGQEIHQSNLGWSPVYVESNLGVMSIGFMLPDPDEAVIWRGPRKNGIIKQFLKDVYWGELDFLVVDAPPGTSDEHISIVQFLQETGIDGAIIVTTPQQVSLIDVRKEVSFCKKVGLNVLGVVENMSGLCQPLLDYKFLRVTETGEDKNVTEWAMEYMREKAPELLDLLGFTEVFDSSGGGAAHMCVDMGVPFLGKVPLDPRLCKAAEEGRSCFDDSKCGLSAAALKRIIDKLVASEMFSSIQNGV